MRLSIDAALFAAAMFAGALNSVAGGGSFIAFPALLLLGVPPIVANATNNAALWLGSVASARGYRREIAAHRHLLLRVAVVSIGGGVLGALLLLRTPVHVFTALVPYLLLVATAVFAVSPYLAKPHSGSARHHTYWQLIAQFFVSIYGGYFGAGMSILILAILAFSGLPSLNAMNGVKNVLALCINGVALIPFFIAGIVWWPQATLMAAGAIIGGYLGARIGRRIPAQHLRRFVIAVGAIMTIYFFVKTYA
ncbi:MAG: sulfite exporter TauE/SafE family protein [Candidatus Eremiobacteraeota bacterium]|nr:sulfite exporter TauE/SafE family protein [Candidatus Eremiobacteraeota bacterium]